MNAPERGEPSHELTQEIALEKKLAQSNNWQLVASSSVLIFKTREGKLITRVNAEGDMDVLNASFVQIGEVASTAQTLRKMN